MNKGDVIFGRKGSDAIHPIVYIKGHDQDLFIGAMLTKSNHFKDNLLMSKAHFKAVDSLGVPYEFKFDNTHLVKVKLIKRLEWQPFRKIGELTSEGLEFLESKIGNRVEKSWEDYLVDNKVGS